MLACISFGQNRDCPELAEETNLRQLMFSGFEAIPILSQEDVKCIATYYAQNDIKNRAYKLIDSATKPYFKIDGETICILSQYKFETFTVKDFYLSAQEQQIVQYFIQYYNEPMLRKLEQRMGVETTLKLLFEKKLLLDPYVLRERLERLKFGKSLVNLKKERAGVLRVKINTKGMFKDLNFSVEDLNFIVIDENNYNNRYELSSKEIMQDGFLLRTNPIRARSEYWFDFKIRIDYSNLLKKGEIFSCEKIEDFLFQFVHFTVTKDYRLIGHDH